jgi:serine/threonine protein phosphatase PrpC
MIKIETEHSITELGKRNNNEDFCAFIPGLTYIVCDGVGGSEKGEIASNSVVKTFAEDYRKYPNADVAIVLRNAEKKLTDYINENPSALGMATTLTFCQVKDEGVLVGWVGDSRVYQFRNGEIVFSTTDHSWVNEAIQSGIITAEEGVNHPKSNVITRAVQGNHKPTQADSVLLTDIKKGDFFMLCSDGVLESWNDNDLKALFATHNQVEKLTENIKAECSKNSRDNFTAIVFKIKEANILNMVSAKIISPSQTNESNLVTNQTLTKNKKLISVFLKMRIPIGLVLIITVVAVILVFKLSPKKEKPDDKKVIKTEKLNNNATAKTKLNEASAIKEDSENKELQAKFESAMKKGEEALSAKTYQVAIVEFTKALLYKKNDTTAKAKLKEAQDKLNKDS